MAFPIAYAEVGAERVPTPVPPRIALAARRRAVRFVMAGALLWAVAGSALGLATPFEYHLIEDGAPVRYILPMAVFLPVGMMGWFVLEVIGPDLARWFGHGRRSWGESSVRLVGPRGTAATGVAAALGGFGAGLVAGVVLRVVRGEPVLVVLGVLVVDAALFRGACARARRAWTAARRERAEHERILADGLHVVARVGSVRPQQEWIGAMAGFLVDLDFEYRGEPMTRTLVLYDHPVWAPAEGNQVDLWLDPADLSRVMVQRRYVDQRFADRPERFRLPGTTDSRLSALAPAWLTEERKSGYRPRKRTAVFPSLAALVTLAAAVLVPVTVDGVPWWTVAALVVHGVLTAVNAAVAWRFVTLGRRFVHTGRMFDVTRGRCRVGLTIVAAGVFFAPALHLRPLSGTAPWTAGHVAVGAALLFGLLLLPWMTVLDELAREVNEEAPAELVQEVLTGHDDRRIDELEADFGYAASLFVFPAPG